MNYLSRSLPPDSQQIRLLYNYYTSFLKRGIYLFIFFNLKIVKKKVEYFIFLLGKFCIGDSRGNFRMKQVIIKNEGITNR